MSFKKSRRLFLDAHCVPATAAEFDALTALRVHSILRQQPSSKVTLTASSHGFCRTAAQSLGKTRAGVHGDCQGAGVRRGRRAPPRTHAQRRRVAPSGRRGTTPKARLTARLASNDAPCLAITPVRRPPTARNDCRTRPRAVAERALRRENCDTGGCGAEHRGNTHGARALQNQPSFDAPSQAAFSPHHSAAVALRVSPPARPPCRLANAIGPGRKGAAGFLTRAKTGTMRKWRTFR